MFLLALACSSPPETAAGESGATDGVVDTTVTFEDPPAGGIQFLGPDLEVPPYSEALYCYYGTYTGEDVGVDFMAPLTSSAYSHHNQLKVVTDAGEPDGTLAPCPDPENGMPVYAPLFESVGFSAEGGAPPEEAGNMDNVVALPEGLAFKLPSGERWVMDMHYVNTTGDTLLVNNAINLGTVPVEEVESWVSAAQFDSGGLELPIGMTSSASFNCAWRESFTVLSLLGHMHDYGLSYTVDWVHNGETTRVYDVQDWGPGYREWPRLLSFADGDFVVSAGDSFRTTCTWYNSTSEILSFPSEMCTTVTVLYPAEAPFSCFNGEYQD